MKKRRPARRRGFTLAEIMVTLVLSGMMTAALLTMLRSQMMIYELNDQITKAQQNGRSGLYIVENILHSACSGIAQGTIAVNVGSLTFNAPCLRVFDGATLSGNTFATTDGARRPDALELVYATGDMTLTTTTSTPLPAGSHTLSVRTGSPTFAIGDLVLVGDYQKAVMFRVSGVSATSLTFDFAGGAPTYGATGFEFTARTGEPSTGWAVMKAASYGIYVAYNTTSSGIGTPTTQDPANGGQNWAQNMLMLDPDGMVGPATGTTANHSDAEPLIEGVEDFQLAVWNDTSPNNQKPEATEFIKTGTAGVTAFEPITAGSWPSGVNHDADGKEPSLTPTSRAIMRLSRSFIRRIRSLLARGSAPRLAISSGSRSRSNSSMSLSASSASRVVGVLNLSGA